MNPCAICGRTPTEEHHVVFGTANRKKAEQMGLVVFLCFDHHRGTYGVHGRDGHPLNLKLKQDAQRKWEETNTRESWMQELGKSYL